MGNRSDHELEIRRAAVEWGRRLFPAGRQIHELVMRQGGERADLAIVEPDRLITVEIKGDADVSTRLQAQAETFRAASDAFAVMTGKKHLAAALALPEDVAVFELIDGELIEHRALTWRAPDPCKVGAALWRSELHTVLSLAGFGCGPRTTRDAAIQALPVMTTEEALRRCYGELRARAFQWREDAAWLADDPIVDRPQGWAKGAATLL